jgi:hypothetical protein
LQVKKLRIMFIPESNNPLENDEIRTRNKLFTKRRITSPVCFNSYYRFSLQSEGQVQKEPVQL